METSPLFTLGVPNLPATKNGPPAPVAVVVRARELEKAPLVPLRKTITPPPAEDLPVICTVAPGTAAPEASVTRISHGDGAHDKKRALGSALLLILKSTAMCSSPPVRLLAHWFTDQNLRDPGDSYL